MRPAPLLAAPTAARLYDAVQTDLAERAKGELRGDGFDGARVRPSFRAALQLALAHGEPLPERPAGPRGQLELAGAA